MTRTVIVKLDPVKDAELISRFRKVRYVQLAIRLEMNRAHVCQFLKGRKGMEEERFNRLVSELEKHESRTTPANRGRLENGREL